MTTNNVIIIILLGTILVYILSCIHNEKYRYERQEVNQSFALESIFNLNKEPYTKFNICHAWSKNYYNHNANNPIKYDHNKSVILKKGGITYNKLQNDCPVILNRKIVEELTEANIIKPYKCYNDYQHNEIRSSIGTNMCYTGPKYPYERLYFPHWMSPNNDGCTVRDNILYTRHNKESNNQFEYGTDCSVKKGSWKTYFDNYSTEYTDAKNVEIDHTIPLKNVWDFGADNWNPMSLRAYANDTTPGHLELMPKKANGLKKDKPINEWVPSDVYRRIPLEVDCQYGADYAAIKHRWNLKLTKEELAVLSDLLLNEDRGCKKILPKSPVSYNKEKENNDSLGIGVSYKKSLTHPQELEIYGLGNNPNYSHINALKTSSDIYTYCNTSNSNISFNKTQTENIKDAIKTELTLYPSDFGIKNLDYLQNISKFHKAKICNIINTHF